MERIVHYAKNNIHTTAKTEDIPRGLRWVMHTYIEGTQHAHPFTYINTHTHTHSLDKR